MPKAPMPPEQVEETRTRILDTALAIIIEDGFNNLSIRKIASRLGVTATTIYNYYANKDELNLMIRIRGFETLYNILLERAAGHDDIEERTKAMINGYVEFGLSYPSYYDIMFNLHTPKYLDYVGTDMEQLAWHEKQTALKCLHLFVEPLSRYLPGKSKEKDRALLYHFTRFWSDLHGLVTLHNSRLFHEVMDDTDAFIRQRIEDLGKDLSRMKQKAESGELFKTGGAQ